jgi:hypothetical protein
VKARIVLEIQHIDADDAQDTAALKEEIAADLEDVASLWGTAKVVEIRVRE